MLTHHQLRGGQFTKYHVYRRFIISSFEPVVDENSWKIADVPCKIEVPRGNRGEKSSKDMASSWNLVSTIGAQASPKWGTEPGVREGKRSLLACHTRCKCSMETTHNSVKVKVGIKVMELVESLIGWKVTVGQGSECHLTFNIRERWTSF